MQPFNKRTHPDNDSDVKGRAGAYNSPPTPDNHPESDDNLYHALNQRKSDREYYDLLYQDEGKMILYVEKRNYSLLAVDL